MDCGLLEGIWLLAHAEGTGLDGGIKAGVTSGKGVASGKTREAGPRGGLRVVGGARGRGASDQPWRPARRVVRSRGVPAAAVVRSGPDWQRPLRGVSFSTLPRALQPWPGALRQQQHHLRVLVPPPPSYLLSGPLHWRAPPGQLHRCGAGWGAASGSNPQPLSAPPFLCLFLLLCRHPREVRCRVRVRGELRVTCRVA